MILIVSHADDDHLTPVLSELDRIGAEAIVIDTAVIPTELAVTAGYSGPASRWRIRRPNGSVLDLGECRSGWWRRALPSRTDPRITDPAQAAWAANETYEAMSGFWDAVPITWVSPPRAIEMSMMKTWQLAAASSVGLAIPRTLITSDPQEAREFIDDIGLGQVICKAFSATTHNWRETRMVTEQELAMLDRVALAPVIFQEYVAAAVDLRITVVGEEIFAAAIHSQELPYALDFRLFLDNASGVRMEPTTLPSEVEDGLRRLLKTAGLRYGAIDMRLTPDGQYVFLEVNPAGQWRFVEQVTGQPITAALAQLLATLDA